MHVAAPFSRTACGWISINNKRMKPTRYFIIPPPYGIISSLDKHFSCLLLVSQIVFWEYCVSASNNFLSDPGHFPQANLSSVTVTSPLEVDFRGFMARQSPHIIERQARRLVGLHCQWGEPVKGHK